MTESRCKFFNLKNTYKYMLYVNFNINFSENEESG